MKIRIALFSVLVLCASSARANPLNDFQSRVQADLIKPFALDLGGVLGGASAHTGRTLGMPGFWAGVVGSVQMRPDRDDRILNAAGVKAFGLPMLEVGVGLPFKIGFSRIQRVFAERGLHDRIAFIGSGKLGFPDAALVAFALGCDLINVGREALLSVGCIQALKCHTNKCPTGITTQSEWLSRGLDPELKAVRLANYIVTLRKEILAVCRAAGATHPAHVSARDIEILNDRFGSQTLADVLGGRGRGTPAEEDPRQRVGSTVRVTAFPVAFRRDPH